MANQKIMEAKIAEVAIAKEKIQKSKSVILVDYKGLTVAQDTELRAAFRSVGAEYKVIKNSVAARAFAELGVEGMGAYCNGPTSIAYGFKDAVSIAKIAKEYGEKFKKTSIKAGYMEGKVLSAAEAMVLATIPPQETLIAMLLGMLTTPMRKLAVALDQIAQKKA